MAEQPDLSGVPTLHSFFETPELYERYHIHLVGVRPTVEGGCIANKTGFKGLLAPVTDPYVTLSTVGPDTGSTEYFLIGNHTSAVLSGSQTPSWDEKCLLIAKKGSTEGVEFKMVDKNDTIMVEDDDLFGFTLLRSEMPPVTLLNDSVWTELVRSSATGRTANTEFVFRVMVTECTDSIVSKQEMEDFCQDTEHMTYTEEVITDGKNNDDPEDNALLQCWRHTSNGGEANKAVLWVLGRNDTFSHPHVVKKLFFENKFDLFVLNYKMNGHCRKHGWVKDAHFNSHNKYGTFDVYINDVEKSLDLISGCRDYGTLLGYAHSTGAPLLLNYVIEKGDAAFDGFIFNSPFLDWGFVGGNAVEVVLENLGFVGKYSKLMSLDTKVGTVATTPEKIKDAPIMYLGQEIVLSDWSARLWSQYYFEWGARPLYNVPMTIGFANGVTGVHEKIQKLSRNKNAVTSKPFVCITSRADDVLKVVETLFRADWIGPSRCELEMNYNGHDVFLSTDASDANMAIDLVAAWMKHARLS